MLVLSPSKWECLLNKHPAFQRRLLRNSSPCLKVLRHLKLLRTQNREQQGVREIWAPRRTCSKWAQGSHCWFICPFIQHAMNSCPVSGPGHSTGVEGRIQPKSHFLLLGWQERLPLVGPASGNLLGVSTGDQDLRLLCSGLMGPTGGW